MIFAGQTYPFVMLSLRANHVYATEVTLVFLPGGIRIAAKAILKSSPCKCCQKLKFIE